MANYNTALNIIILNEYEEPIGWLDSEKCEIIETNTKGAQKHIQITYPLDGIVGSDQKQWFEQGNKIFIPSTLGLDSCLYVINTSYSLDFWDKNELTVNAEEVLTEFNYMMYTYTSSTPLSINKDNLQKWFGQYYTIGTIDTLPAKKDTITPAGTLTKMSLLRLIEEETGYFFKTEYSFNNNIISRKLHLLKQENMESNNTEGHPEHFYYLDLAHNVESLELDVDESNTYTAMAPVISLQEGVTNIKGTVTSTDTNTIASTVNSATSNVSTNRTELKKIIDNWLDLEVQYRQEIPMIVESQDDGSFKYTKTWYAPFIKEKGSIEIRDVAYSNTMYTQVIPPQTNNLEFPPKMGTVTTTEKDRYAIYNVLANSLLQKRTPKFELKIDVKDIQQILGVDNLGYNLWDTLYVRVPGFDYYVRSIITETKKNPHLPGENTLKIESDITGRYLQMNTIILADNRIVDNRNKEASIGGVLKTVDGNPLVGGRIDVSVTLVEAYKGTNTEDTTTNTDKSNTIQAVLDFKPETEKYIFSEFEIKNMSKIVRNSIIDKAVYPTSVNMRTNTGKIYRVPFQWCRAIWYARNQWFLAQDEAYNLGSGQFSSTIQVYNIKNIDEEYKKSYKSIFTNNKETPLYKQLQTWSAWFYYLIDAHKQYIKDKYGVTVKYDPVSSVDIQTGGDCGLVAMSNATEALWNYYSESECANILQISDFKPGIGTIEGVYANDYKKMSKKGFNVFFVPATWSNILKYTNDLKSQVLIDTGTNGRVNGTVLQEDHAMHIVCAFTASDGTNYVYIENSNYPDMCPYMSPLSIGISGYTKWNVVYNVIDDIKIKGKGNAIYSLSASKNVSNISTKVICIVQLSSSQRALDVVDRTVKSDSSFNPFGLSYSFYGNDIKNAYKKLIQEQWKNNPHIDKTTLNCTLTDMNGQTWKMSGRWIIALFWAYAYNYRNNTNTLKAQQNFIVTIKKDSPATWYYNTLNTLNWWPTLTYPNSELMKKLKENGKVQLSLLAWQHVYYKIGEYYTLYELKKNKPQINKIKLDCTKENIQKYLPYGVMVGNIPVDDTILNEFSNLRVLTDSSGYETIILHNITSKGDVKCLFPWRNGNSPTNQPDTPRTSANPCAYETLDINDVVSWHNKAMGSITTGRNLGNDAIELGKTLAGKYKFCSGQAQTYEAMKNSSTKCGSCWAWSDALYTELDKLGYHVRIIQYRTSRAVNHRSVQYMNTNGVWVDYPYHSVGLTTGMQSTSSKPGLSLVRENKVGSGKSTINLFSVYTEEELKKVVQGGK